jgi:hypothetical protein
LLEKKITNKLKCKRVTQQQKKEMNERQKKIAIKVAVHFKQTTRFHCNFHAKTKKLIHFYAFSVNENVNKMKQKKTLYLSTNENV